MSFPILTNKKLRHTGKCHCGCGLKTRGKQKYFPGHPEFKKFR